VLKSAVVGLLLFSVVTSSVVGAEVTLLLTLIVAWLLFPVLVGGIRSTLDAECAFTLIILGVMVVVSLAQNGLSSLLP